MKQSTLGAAIRALRTQNNMTQARLADIMGVTDKAVSKWERDISYPDIALFPKLADVLGTSADALLRECQEEYRQPKLLETFQMSRDIRMPLHIILGFVEIIRNNHDDPEMLQRYLDGIRISGEYMISLIDQLQEEKDCDADMKGAVSDPKVKEESLDQCLQERIASKEAHLPVARFPGKKVLVVDDMAINRGIAAQLLKQTGAETEFAEDGRACLQMVRDAPAGYYDLILMDIMMPNMDGIEATRRIRRLSDPMKAKVPIIAMTTNVSETDRDEALAAGMDAFEEKPILVDKLFETMGRYI